MNINHHVKFVGLGLEKRQRCFYWLVLFLLIIGGQTAYSQVCDPEIKPIEDWELQYRKRGNRCEGLHYYHPVGIFLEVMSVIQGNFHFMLEKEEVLTISSPVITDQLIHVCATSIPPKSGYRMDAQLAAGQNLTWPVKDVLYPAKISDKDIGIFGWIGKKSEKIYVPVVVASMLDLDENNGKIRLYLLTSDDVETVMWRSFDEISGSCSGIDVSKRNDVTKISSRPWKPIEILLPSSKTGTLCVEIVAGSQKTQTWVKKNIRVIVGPVKR